MTNPTSPALSREQIKNAIQSADTAFWAAIAKAFPEVTTGDISPMKHFLFPRAQKEAIEAWLLANHPSRAELPLD
ncbi:MAG: hypothetical protein ACYDEV_10660 [Acidiferrobacter sp.]